MKRNLTLLFVVFMLFETGTAQVIRSRLSANSGIFLGEVSKKEIPPPLVNSHPGSQDFKPALKPGAELEIIAPFSRTFEMGVQFGYDNYAGHTPTAPLYNFFLSRYNPMPLSNRYPDEALIYDTHILKILGTARWYFLSYSKELNFFMKYFGGVAFTGADFTFDNPVHSVRYEVGVLHSRGTKNSDFPKTSGITGGAGLGAAYRLSDRFDLYFDATASLINSDIVNGVPNYNYVTVDNVNRMERTNAISATMQASIGIIYSAIPDRRINKSNITRSNSMNRNSFMKRKAKSTFSKKRGRR